MVCVISGLYQFRFKYDSVHGRYDGDVQGDKEGLTINGNKIKTFAMMYVLVVLHMLLRSHALHVVGLAV